MLQIAYLINPLNISEGLCPMFLCIEYIASTLVAIDLTESHLTWQNDTHTHTHSGVCALVCVCRLAAAWS